MGVPVRHLAANQARPQLSTGEEQIFSYFRPTLEGGDYIVSTTQTISARDSTAILKQEEQEFTVATPRFRLPDGAVKSVFPPPGYTAAVETLPHIVFSDPYLPWERQATATKQTTTSRVPWMAVLAFTEDELLLPQDQRTGDTSIFKNISSQESWEQDASLSVAIQPSILSKVTSCRTPISSIDGIADTDVDKVNAIFIRSRLFNELFRNSTASAGTQKHPDVSRYAFLSHVRRFDTTGMAESGSSREAYYSIVLSHRVGSLASDGTPVPVHVHLISLDGIESMAWPVPESTRHVAVASLYSWTYMCGREGAFDVKQTMRVLADSLGPLRAPLPDLSTLVDTPERQTIVDRVRDGYVLGRCRVQTGETTATFYRGVLTPNQVQHPISPTWSLHSDSGMDLQILDGKLGMLDITYSASWQLGRNTAIADQAFCRAMTSLRRQIHVMAMNRAKAVLMRAHGTCQTRDDALRAAPAIVQELGKLQSTETDRLPSNGNLDMLDWWMSKPKEPVNLANEDDDVYIYNELNQAANPEWSVVLGWVLDKMYLSSIPSQYLVTDPSHLPAESLRFFHIDANWVDAFLDGALSIGNHLENRFDSVRTAIKRLVNNYLRTPLPSTGRPPPIPTYGFLLRSNLISHFPDLRVEAEYDPLRTDSIVSSILRQASVADGVLLCLLDVSPHGGQPSCSRLTSLKFTQPPHQQSFTVGDRLDEDELWTSYRRIYTTFDGSSDKSDLLCRDEVLKRNAPPNKVEPPIFDWGQDNSVRCLQFPAFSDKLLRNLQKYMPRDEEGTFRADAATSAMVGLQLTKRICELEVTAAATTALFSSSTSSVSAGPRALWIPRKPDSLM
ncbi:hypothetical protein M406DRAFT_261691 [Cryphonectria parasitica EP155]|uniref:Uncharacterized protein n=1 Tax=Cryphonectria parasitica (strain ATCC 38755 / EP155) TaxID=660469 RepID=A0A9P4XZ43_CRYP1|nr:uncharacterized protein M406DRAFT_261691 [Cryphonectria parasitica EP155]KAF3764017.1 hypothetical protein M406DRAFT_261691 [Cryphonectria parasitica EP155]